MSVFSSDEFGCGVFGGEGACCGGMTYALSHARAAHLHYGTAPVQDARGEIRLSYIGIGTATGDMQPLDRGVLREIHGVVIEVGWLGLYGSWRRFARAGSRLLSGAAS